MALRPDPALILHQAKSLQVAIWRDLLVQRWTAANGLADVQTLDKVQRELVTSRPGTKYHMVTMLEIPSIRSLDDATRNAMKANRAFMRQHLAASAVVLSADGFVASFLRGLISAHHLWQRSAYPSAVTSSVAAASVFLAPRMRDALHAEIAPATIETVLTDLVKRLCDIEAGTPGTKPISAA